MNVTDSFFRSDQGQDFVCRIERHIESAFVPIGYRFAERRHTFVGGILVMFRVLCR